MPNNTITQLQSEIDSLKQKLEKQDVFIATAVHDLRSPLTIAILAVDLLEDLEKNEEAFQMLKKALERLKTMMERFLSVPKLERGNLKVELKQLDLKKFMQNFYEIHLPLLEKGQIKFTFENKIADQNISIPTDELLLLQVFENLINNALRFVPDDGNGEIILKAELSDAGKFRISFSDNGCGVPDKQKTKIFEKFASHSKKQSTGLGLYICQNIIKTLGGRIWCEDSVGGGATFCVELPIKAPAKSHQS